MNRALQMGSAPTVRCCLALTALVLAALASAACSARTPVDATPIRQQPLPAVEPAALEYRLQVDDLLEIKFWGNEELDEEVRVRPDGRISLPFVDDVQAAGLTPRELDEKLVELYRPELAQPDITVIVNEGSSQVYIGGEVRSQGPVRVTGPMTLVQAIHAAGGFLNTARRKQVLLIRRPAVGDPVARSIDLRPILSGAMPQLDLTVKPSDIIFVPRTKIANVNLFVQQYINQILPLSTISAAAATQATEEAFQDSETNP